MLKLKLFHTPELNKTRIRLPGSKSESNRALIITALGNLSNPINNLSEARDTSTMVWLLRSKDKELNVIDAGTTMRFLVAYFALTSDERILTGSHRMQERPIGTLVDALREIGAQIDYLGVEGFPPLLLKSFPGQKQHRIKLKGDISSQYISALLMIAPTLPQGLLLEIDQELVSRPYVEMTLAIMKEYGATGSWQEDSIQISPQQYIGVDYQVESDWSAASYWYSLVSLAKADKITLIGLRENSNQGDQQIATIMNKLGVATKYVEDAVVLSTKQVEGPSEIDFKPIPDLAQTVAVSCAGLGKTCKFTGIENLAIKETDRISALIAELGKFGVDLVSSNEGHWKLSGRASLKSPQPLEVATYHDHRMAMSFACLAALGDIVVQDPYVVDKSYPGFWKHLALAGIKMEFSTS